MQRTVHAMSRYGPQATRQGVSLVDRSKERGKPHRAARPSKHPCGMAMRIATSRTAGAASRSASRVGLPGKHGLPTVWHAAAERYLKVPTATNTRAPPHGSPRPLLVACDHLISCVHPRASARRATARQARLALPTLHPSTASPPVAACPNPRRRPSALAHQRAFSSFFALALRGFAACSCSCSLSCTFCATARSSSSCASFASFACRRWAGRRTPRAREACAQRGALKWPLRQS